MNEDRALEQQFLDRAKALTNVAEVFRCLQVTMLICDMVAFGVRAEAKIFEAAYGEPSGQKYWDAHLSEPIRVYTLAHVLSAHLAFAAPSGIGPPSRPPTPNHVVEQALAHTISNAVEAAYRRGDLFEKRRHLMNDWAAFCERPGAGADVALRREAQ